MTTPAAIAPSTNSFTSSLGHSGRFFSSGKTSDATAGIPSAPDDDSSTSQDTGSDDGSSFLSVLKQFYSSQDDSGSTPDKTNESGKTNAKGDSTGDATSTTTPAISVLPLSDDGTQRRTKTSALATLSASNTNLAPPFFKSPDKSGPKTTAPAVDDRTQAAQLPASIAVPAPIVVSVPEPEPDTDQPVENLQPEAQQTNDAKAGPVPESSPLPRTATISTSGNSVEPPNKAATATNLTDAPAAAALTPAATQSAPVNQPSEPVVVPAKISTSDAAPSDPPQAFSSKTTSVAKPIIFAKPDPASDTRPTADAVPESPSGASQDQQPAKPVAQDASAAISPATSTASSAPVTDTPQQATSDTRNPAADTRRTQSDRPVVARARYTAASKEPPATQANTSKLVQDSPKSAVPAATAPLIVNDSEPVDDQSFQSVLNQVDSSQPPQAHPVADEGTDDSNIPATQPAPAVNPANPPKAKTREIATPTAAPANENDPLPAPIANPSAGIATPVEQGDPATSNGPFLSSKPGDPTNPSRASVALPPIETSTASDDPAPSGELAFAARLTPANSNENAASPNGNDSKPHAAPPPAKPAESDQAASDAPPPADHPHAVPASGQPAKAEANLSLPQPMAPPQQPAPTHAAPSSAPSNPSPAARMEPVVEAPAQPPTNPRDITVRVPDSTDRGTDVRFVERGGEIHVSVRTSDAEVAQTLRGGLSDFVGRMEHTGIRAEVWRPGQDAAQSQNQSQPQQSFDRDQKGDSRGSGSGRNQQGSAEQENHRQGAEKPGWVEELESSLAQSGKAVL